MQATRRCNSWARKALAIASVPALAAPSAIGVYSYLAPESGSIAAGLAAIGFEALYVSVNILILRSPELRRYARNVALAAVATAVLLNTLAHYQMRVVGAFTGAPFNTLAALLALAASLPLAGLAYAASVLLHRLSEDEAAATAVLEEMLEEPPAVTVSSLPRPALAVSGSDVSAPLSTRSDAPLSKSARMRALAKRRKVSESTAWRKVKAGEWKV